MAAKKTRKKKNNIKQLINDERFKISLGLFLIFFAIYIFIAQISYLFTWKTDQSFIWQNVFSEASIYVENWAGKAGAFLAQVFMNKWFGLASLSIPFLLAIYGLRLVNFKLLPLRRTTRITIALTVILSLLLSYVFQYNVSFLGSGPGGRHGFIIIWWLNSFAGKTGTAFILLFAILSFVQLSFPGIFYKLKRFVLPGNGEQGSGVPEEYESSNEDAGVNEQEGTGIPEDEDLVFETEFASNNKESDELEVLTMEEESDNESDSNQIENEDSEEGVNFHISEKVEEDLVKKNKPMEDYDPTKELSLYKYPTLDLLEEHVINNSSVSNEELVSNKNKIVETLANYKIQIDKIKATIGPTITLYEIVPAPGIRISKIKNLEDDIALSLAALGIRIIAPMPGKGTIGIEVPNQHPDIVSMKSIVSSRRFQESKHELAIALGKTISNETYVFDLAKMPHLLVAGATGQGKSVGLNAIIASLLYKKHPSQLKLVMIDPKKVELTLYSRIEKHFLAKLPEEEEAIITDTQKVIYTLNSLCIEMDGRYDLLKKASVRNIKEYNQKFIKRQLNPENGHRYLPYIVVIIDEFADLIMTAGREVETPLARLAQLARAIGIHMVIATQRPTTNIITGVIKANFPARIAFRVTSGVDSKTILDSTGANQLIGRGDMLISSGSDLVRLQCAFIDIPELDRITDFISNQQGYTSAFELPEYVDENTTEIGAIDLDKRDDLFDDAARLVVQNQQGSTSLIQRKFSIGYNRAGRIIDQLEAAGIVGPFEGSKARQVLIPDDYALEQYLNDLNK